MSTPGIARPTEFGLSRAKEGIQEGRAVGLGQAVVQEDRAVLEEVKQFFEDRLRNLPASIGDRPDRRQIRLPERRYTPEQVGEQ